MLRKLHPAGFVVLVILGVIYLLLLYKFLLSHTVPSFNHVRKVNLIPFKDSFNSLIDRKTPVAHRIYEFMGNLLIFSPVVIVMMLLGMRPKARNVFLTFAFVSTFFELLQYLLWTWRVSDINDVILNSGGATLTYIALRKVFPKFFVTQNPL